MASEAEAAAEAKANEEAQANAAAKKRADEKAAAEKAAADAEVAILTIFETKIPLAHTSLSVCTVYCLHVSLATAYVNST